MSAWLRAPYSSSAARTAKSARAPSGMRRANSRAPSVDTLFACQLASPRSRAGAGHTCSVSAIPPS